MPVDITIQAYTAPELAEANPNAFQKAMEEFQMSWGLHDDHPDLHTLVSDFSANTGVAVQLVSYNRATPFYSDNFAFKYEGNAVQPQPLPDNFGDGGWATEGVIEDWNINQHLFVENPDPDAVAAAVAEVFGRLVRDLDTDIEDQLSPEYFVEASEANEWLYDINGNMM